MKKQQRNLYPFNCQIISTVLTIILNSRSVKKWFNFVALLER